MPDLPPSQPTVRRRSLPAGFSAIGKMTFGNTRPVGTIPAVSTAKNEWSRPGTQVTVSENHPNYPKKGKKNPTKGFKGDVGGEFFTQEKSVKVVNNGYASVSTSVLINSTTGNRRISTYRGPMLAIDPSSSSYQFPPSSALSNDEMDELGATAIARCKPTNSVADVAVMLGELMREGLPKLIGAQSWKDKTSNIRKSAGGEYLNVQFGWLPLIGGVRDISSAISRAEDILSQYERDSGKMVRRRFTFPTTTTREEKTILESAPVWYKPTNSDISSATSGRLVRIREKIQVVSFSGAFTYYLPSGYDSRSRFARNAAEAKKLLGISLTPDTLWNLAPWSWAIDWFSNSGDVISNLTDWATDGLVMRYGYVMVHTIVTDTYQLESSDKNKQTSLVHPVRFVTETKQRRKANPFGFGVSWDGLSPRQIAITVALGLSRS